MSQYSAYILLFFACLLDVITTCIGLSRGFVETHTTYFPFLSFLVLAPTLFCINHLPYSNHADIKEMGKAGLFLVALTPALNNAMFILGLRFL